MSTYLLIMEVAAVLWIAFKVIERAVDRFLQ